LSSILGHRSKMSCCGRRSWLMVKPRFLARVSGIFTDIYKAGHSPDQAENLIHDHRVRVMKAYEKSPDDPEIPPEFLDRVTKRRQAFVEKLNATMLPLVGGNSDVQVRHQKIAKVAAELNLRTSAYRGIFEVVKPHMNEPFNPERHADENPGSDYPDLAGKPILVTTMKVKVWPENNTERDSKQTNRRIVPKKRQVGEVA
jgi:hypothetical protein